VTDLNERACYCSPGDISCGICERCREPGHTRHFPGPVPYTGAWCDRCYRIVGTRHRVISIAVPLLIAVAILLALWLFVK
jgi:hypothetical protein